jgi:hypothetical protein
MDENDEVLALLLGECDDTWRDEDIDLESTSCLVRRPDGNIGLEKVHSREQLERTAETTGVFRQGKPITDPVTGEVIGYELEEITEHEAASA